MTDESSKETIQEDEIQTKDVDRRKFLLGSAGTVIASTIVAASTTSCAPSDACDYDSGNTAPTYDSDPYNTVATYDADSGNSCDSD